MRILPKNLLAYLDDARAALRFAPVEIAMGVATATAFSIFLRREDMEPWMHMGAAAALAFPLVFGLSILRRRNRIHELQRWIGTGVVLLSAAAWSLFVFNPDLESEGWRFVALAGASVFALTLVPAIGNREHLRVRLWHFNHVLVTRTAVLGLYTLVLYGALAGAMAAVISLFDLSSPEYLYQDLFGVLFFAVLPWMIAGAVPSLAAAAESEVDTPLITRLFGRFVFLPVLLLYLLIVLAYVLKIVITGELPKNLLSPLVLAAGVFGFLLAPLLQPLVDGDDRSGVARLVRLFPFLLIPAIPPAIWAIWVRRDQYGWTEFRYVRMALLIGIGALAVMGVIRFFRKRKPLMLEIPLLLGGILFLSAVGPWSAQSVSQRNQQHRLRTALREANLLVGDRLSLSDTSARSVSEELYRKIQGSAYYLYHAHGPEALRSVADMERFATADEFIKALHIEAECAPQEGARRIRADLPSDRPLPVAQGFLFRFSGGGSGQGSPDTLLSARLPDDSTLVAVIADSSALTIQHGGSSSSVDMGGLLQRLSGGVATDCAPGYKTPTLSDEEAFHRLEADGASRGILILTDVTGFREDPEEAFRLGSVSGMVVIEH